MKRRRRELKTRSTARAVLLSSGDQVLELLQCGCRPCRMMVSTSLALAEWSPVEYWNALASKVEACHAGH